MTQRLQGPDSCPVHGRRFMDGKFETIHASNCLPMVDHEEVINDAAEGRTWNDWHEADR